MLCTLAPDFINGQELLTHVRKLTSEAAYTTVHWDDCSMRYTLNAIGRSFLLNREGGELMA